MARLTGLSRSISGATAIVTGAGKGIGRSIARGLADAGAKVVLAARTLDATEKIAAEIREHAAKNHRTNRQSRFGRHADQPRQPVEPHSFLAEHLPGVHEYRRAELGSGSNQISWATSSLSDWMIAQAALTGLRAWCGSAP